MNQAFIVVSGDRACFKVRTEDEKEVSFACNRAVIHPLYGPIAAPDFTDTTVKVFDSMDHSDGTNYSNQHSDDAVAMLHALADTLGYTVTPKQE